MNQSEALDYFQNELAAQVWENKYRLRDENDNPIETSPDETIRRVTSEFVRIEQQKFKKPRSFDTIYSWLQNFSQIIPQGSPLYGIGNPRAVSLSNCFVLHPPVDSYGGVHYTDEQLTQICKRRGGVGIDISHIRPAGMTTQNSSRSATGIIPFMERYSNSIREVGQNGRRGALMISLNVHHPQVVEFARCKRDKTKVTGANISVRLTDEFLEAVKNDEEYEQRWPVMGPPKISKMVSARKVWLEIIENAHHMAEPGLLFWDTILRESPADCYAKFGYATVSTNPCSELPLSILDSCRLLLLNLFGFVRNPFTPEAYFDFKLFYERAQDAQRLMDDLIDLEIEKIQEIINKVQSDPEEDYIKDRELNLWQQVLKNCENGRRTGTGITALGDAMAAVGIKYGSRESIEFTDKVYKTLKFGCYQSSVDMARELGPFPVWGKDLEKDCPFLLRFKEEELDLGDEVISGEEIWESMQVYGRRNISLLTTAPAGSVSIIAGPGSHYGTTSGIEPLFMTDYTRRRKINPKEEVKVDFTDQNGDCWQEYKVYHPKLQMWMDVTDETDIKKSPYFGACAEEIDWQQRVRLQAAAGQHVDHSISSTINLPEDVTVEQVATIYETAWEAGLKGITVYRKNCRTGVLVDSNEAKKQSGRPKQLDADIHITSVKGTEYFVVVGLKNETPYEVFAGPNKDEDGRFLRKKPRASVHKVKKGQYDLYIGDELLEEDISAHCTDEMEAITRLVSSGLRCGDVEPIVRQMEKVRGDMYGFARALSRVLKKYIKDGTKVEGENCPECESELVRQEGCMTCMSCGWTKCS